MTLEDRLERLASRTPPGDPADVMADARDRAESQPEPRRPRFLAAAAAVLAIVALAAGGLALTAGDDSESVTVAGPDGSQAADGLDGLWRVVSTVDDGERQPAEGTASLRFDGDSVQGSDGCNNRIVTTFDDGVVVPPKVRTQVGCPDDAATEEADLFWAGLGQPVELRDGELWLLADDGDGLVFSRVDEGREVPAEAEPTVTVAVDGFGPVEATVSPLTASEQGWLEHTVTLTNTGTDTVHLQDFRTGTMLGDREVAAATDGCGYGSSGDQPVMMGCRYDYRPVTIEGGGAHTFTVTLWRDLAGMNPVGGGPYEWWLPVDRRDTRFDHLDQTATTGTVTLTYENLAVGQPVGDESVNGTQDQVQWRPVAVNSFEVLDDTSMRLTLDYCGNAHRVQVGETGDAVTLSAETSDPGHPPAPDCATVAVVELDGPIGDRAVVDSYTSETVGERSDRNARQTDVSNDDAETIVNDFLRLADEPSTDAVERLPFAEEVALGLGSALYQTRSRSQLADPAAWVIEEEYFRAYSGPFSALDVAAEAQGPTVSIGEHPHCASPPVPPPDAVADFVRVSVQPDIEQIDSCLQWWTVDFFINEAGQIEAVTLDLWEP